MNGDNVVASGSCRQVRIEHIGIERSNRRHQFGYGFQTRIERLERGQLILRHAAAPETFTVQADVPVGEIVVHEVRNQSSGFGRLVFVVAVIHILHQRVQHGDNPSVYFRTFRHGHIGFLVFKSVHVGIEGKERIRII